MIIKDDLQFQEGRKDTLINAYIIIEVLSKSTRSVVFRDKFDIMIAYLLFFQ